MQIPKVRVDILFYYCLIVYLITCLLNSNSNLKMIRDEIAFIKNSLNNTLIIENNSRKWEKEWDDTNKDVIDKQ